MGKLIFEPARSEEVEPIEAKHPSAPVVEQKEVDETNAALACLLEAVANVQVVILDEIASGFFHSIFQINPIEGEEVSLHAGLPVVEKVDGEEDDPPVRSNPNPEADIPDQCVACECPLRRSAIRDGGQKR